MGTKLNWHDHFNYLGKNLSIAELVFWCGSWGPFVTDDYLCVSYFNIFLSELGILSIIKVNWGQFTAVCQIWLIPKKKVRKICRANPGEHFSPLFSSLKYRFSSDDIALPNYCLKYLFIEPSYNSYLCN